MFRATKLSSMLLLISFVLVACSQATKAPTTLHPPPPIITLTPTRTPFPTLPPTPTFTPFPTLSGNKPYLMVKQDFENQEFVIYDANGIGRKTIELPSDGHIRWTGSGLDQIVSPDGQWIVFYTGNFGSTDIPENLPITLKLMNIADGTVKAITDVVTTGYKDKLELVAERLKELEPDYYQPIDDHDWVSGSVIFEFEWVIHSVRWSPDSRKLAFAAQIDGISSDIYLYDLETETIQRVEDSLQSIQWIQWSPDGKYIVFTNSHPGYVYTGSSLYAVKPSSQVIKNPKTLYYGTWLSIGYWLSPNSLLVSDGTDTAGNFNLQALNIETGRLKTLWDDGFGAYSIDYKNQIIAMNTSEEAQFENLGLYYITFEGRQTKIFDGLYWLSIFFRGGEKHRFLAQGVSVNSDQIKVQYPMTGDAVGIDLSGKPAFLGKFDYTKISISPDQIWLLMYDDKNLYLYDANDELIRTFPIPNIQKIIWRPDSQAIYYLADNGLYTLPIPSGEPKWVDDIYIREAIWLP